MPQKKDLQFKKEKRGDERLILLGGIEFYDTNVK